MCGINGIYGLSDTLKSKSLVDLMNNKMAHRGPNDSGIFVNNKIALGHRRLSIIDLSQAGHQPMESNDGRLKIIYNGELYNYKELKFDLERAIHGTSDTPYHFKTLSDTEVILASYLRWGMDCVNRFNGMWGLAIWDELKQELFISRDRLGIKPVYYFHNGEQFVFSSEIRALLQCGFIEKKINKNGLCDYLRYQTVHAPNTIIDKVKMLMPGYNIIVNEEGMKLKQYWNIAANFPSASFDEPYDVVCKNVKNLLQKAVERRLVSDVPFGAFLSGGIDSSAIVGLMSNVASEKIKTFSVTFDDEKYSEAKYATLIAKKFNTEHHEIKLTSTNFKEELPNALKSMDHPSGDGTNTYIVSKATKNAGITMALSGLGGDELFAGYDIFKRALKLEKYKWVSAFPGRGIAGVVYKKLKPSIASAKMAELLNLNSFNFANTYPLSRQVLLENQIRKLLNNENLSSNNVALIIKQFTNNNNALISTISMAEITTYMQNVLLRDTDQMSMAHALEVRVPFLDYKLVEYVLGLSDKHKIPITPKKLLVDSLGDLLPDEIVNRPKMGFTFPWTEWLKNDLKSFCESRLKSLSERNIINANELKSMWQKFINDDKSITWSRIWYIVVLEHWLIENGID